MDQTEMFVLLLEAAMKDAAYQNKVTRLNLTIDPDGSGKKTVRVVVLSDVPQEMGKEEIEKQLCLLELTQGFHYTADGARVIVTPEVAETKFTKDGVPYSA